MKLEFVKDKAEAHTAAAAGCGMPHLFPYERCGRHVLYVLHITYTTAVVIMRQSEYQLCTTTDQTVYQYKPDNIGLIREEKVANPVMLIYGSLDANYIIVYKKWN